MLSYSIIITELNQQQKVKITVQQIFDFEMMPSKQGLLFLKQQALRRGVKVNFDQRIVAIPIYSFINQLISCLKEFINSHQYQCWYSYFIDHYSHQKSLSNLIRSWEKLRQTSLQCNLLINLLTIDNKNKVKLYLKARKLILQTTSNSAMIDQILLSLEDSISIIYKVFQNEGTRKAIITGIKNIFVAFKMFQAKIYSSVLIQYLLAVYDSIFKHQFGEATINEQFNTHKSFQKGNNSNYVQLYSSIQNFQSSIHEQNGLYKKSCFTQANNKKYQIIDRKFLPLKQTSMSAFLENQNKSMGSSGQRNPQERQKSLFYAFIRRSSPTPKEDRISEEPSDFQRVNSFYKCLDKKETYNSTIADRYGRDESLKTFKCNKENQILQMKCKAEQSLIAQPAKKIFQNELYPSDNNLNQKNCALTRFQKKMFQSSQSEERLSLLRGQKAKVKRDALLRQNQTEKKMVSTDIFQIQNHLLNKNRKSTTQKNLCVKQMNKIQQINQNQSQNSHKSQSQSCRQQDFRKMINKNQQFKQKMLKKSYPQNLLIQNSKSWEQKQIENYPFQSKGDFLHFQKTSEKSNQNCIQIILSKQIFDDKPKIQIKSSILPLKEGILGRYAHFQQNKNIIKSYNNSYQTRNRYRQAGGLYKQGISSNSPQDQINQENSYNKPQPIRKGMTQSRNYRLLKQNIGELSAKNNIGRRDVQPNSCVNVTKMKQMIRIIDDYHNNFEDTHQLQSNLLQIYNSVSKKPKFQPQNSLNYDQVNCDPISANDHSFYQ